MDSVSDAGIARDRKPALFGWLAGLAQRQRMRRAIAWLEAFDDDRLRDLGISRGAIRDAVRQGRG
jgi:uncharacterized protein YjiS (DUF1127 family)